jgi:hypothetical protein
MWWDQENHFDNYLSLSKRHLQPLQPWLKCPIKKSEGTDGGRVSTGGSLGSTEKNESQIQQLDFLDAIMILGPRVGFKYGMIHRSAGLKQHKLLIVKRVQEVLHFQQISIFIEKRLAIDWLPHEGGTRTKCEGYRQGFIRVRIGCGSSSYPLTSKSMFWMITDTHK